MMGFCCGAWVRLWQILLRKSPIREVKLRLGVELEPLAATRSVEAMALK